MSKNEEPTATEVDQNEATRRRLAHEIRGKRILFGQFVQSFRTAIHENQPEKNIQGYLSSLFQTAFELKAKFEKGV